MLHTALSHEFLFIPNPAVPELRVRCSFRMLSFGRHLSRIHFKKFEAAVAHVLGLIQAVPALEATDEKVATGHERKVTARWRFE
jgi:hypothetical protein